jgi:hypothetical protein
MQKLKTKIIVEIQMAHGSIWSQKRRRRKAQTRLTNRRISFSRDLVVAAALENASAPIRPATLTAKPDVNFSNSVRWSLASDLLFERMHQHAFQNGPTRGSSMTNSYRSETLRSIATNQLRIATLINNLTWSASILAADIEHEEVQTRVRDLREPGYPALARNLRARRDNLLATVASLEAIRRPDNTTVD